MPSADDRSRVCSSWWTAGRGGQSATPPAATASARCTAAGTGSAHRRSAIGVQSGTVCWCRRARPSPSTSRSSRRPSPCLRSPCRRGPTSCSTRSPRPRRSGSRVRSCDGSPSRAWRRGSRCPPGRSGRATAAAGWGSRRSSWTGWGSRTSWTLRPARWASGSRRTSSRRRLSSPTASRRATARRSQGSSTWSRGTGATAGAVAPPTRPTARSPTGGTTASTGWWPWRTDRSVGGSACWARSTRRDGWTPIP